MENKCFYVGSENHKQALESSGMPSQFFPFIQTKDHLLFEQMDQQYQYTKMMELIEDDDEDFYLWHIWFTSQSNQKWNIKIFPSLVKMLKSKQQLFENL